MSEDEKSLRKETFQKFDLIQALLLPMQIMYLAGMKLDEIVNYVTSHFISL